MSNELRNQILGSSFTREPRALGNFQVVRVKVSLDRVDKLVKTFCKLIDNSTTKSNVIPPDMPEKMKRWLYTGFYLRAAFVSGEHKFRPFDTSSVKFLKTITTMAQLWSYIGNAVNLTYKLKFIPEFDPYDASKGMTFSEYTDFTHELETHPRALTIGRFPNTDEGDPAFMAMVWMEQALKSFSPNDAAYVFASTLVKKTTENNWYNDHALITYADEDEMESELSIDVLTRIFRGASPRTETVENEQPSQ